MPNAWQEWGQAVNINNIKSDRKLTFSHYDAALQAAREGATASGRLQLYKLARRWSPPPWVAEPWMGLSDPDPAIRYLELDRLSRNTNVPTGLRDALRSDESALVRELAQRIWP